MFIDGGKGLASSSGKSSVSVPPSAGPFPSVINKNTLEIIKIMFIGVGWGLWDAYNNNILFTFWLVSGGKRPRPHHSPSLTPSWGLRPSTHSLTRAECPKGKEEESEGEWVRTKGTSKAKYILK